MRIWKIKDGAARIRRVVPCSFELFAPLLQHIEQARTNDGWSKSWHCCGVAMHPGRRSCCWWAPTILLHLRFPNHHPSNTWVWLNSPRHSGHRREEAGVADSDNRDNLSHPSILCVLAVHAAHCSSRFHGVRVITEMHSWTEWLQIPTKQCCTHIEQPPRQIRSLRRGHEVRRSVGGYPPPAKKKLNPAT